MIILHFALAQLNFKVGDLAGNQQRILDAITQARPADLLLTSELSICGYPPEDFLLRPAFIDACMAAVQNLAKQITDKPYVLVGSPWRYRGRVYNAAILLGDGVVQGMTFKRMLPNDGVFDERRVFAAGMPPKPIPFKGLNLGVQICEDVWTPSVSKTLAAKGAEVLLVINASPYAQGKWEQRMAVCTARVRETGLPLAYLNMIGGQDELVFDGRSFLLHSSGTVAMVMADFAEEVRVVPWQKEVKHHV